VNEPAGVVKWLDAGPGFVDDAGRHRQLGSLARLQVRVLHRRGRRTSGSAPQARRSQVEMIASLKDLPRAIGPDGNTQISVAPDGSAVFTRDIGTQEIYALTVKWP